MSVSSTVALCYLFGPNYFFNWIVILDLDLLDLIFVAFWAIVVSVLIL